MDPSGAEQISALRDEVVSLRKVISSLEERLDVERGATAAADDGVANPLAEAGDQDDSNDKGASVAANTTSLLHQVRGTYEAMRARPANLHQVTALLCLDPDVDKATKSKYLITSFVVVVAQLLTCRSISGGAKYPSCATSDDCPAGYACGTLSSGGNGDCIRCLTGWSTPENEAAGNFCTRATPEYCTLHTHGGDFVELGETRGCDLGFACSAYDVLNARLSCSLPNHTEFRNGECSMTPSQLRWHGLAGSAPCTREPIHSNAAAYLLGASCRLNVGLGGELCSHCFDPVLAGDHWNLGKHDTWDLMDSIDRMRPGDHTAVFLVAMLVGLACAGEIREIKLCEIEVRRRGTESPVWVQRAVFVLSAARQFALIPLVVASVPYVLFYRGSDSLSLCFNA
eukprot:COSAG03_NODE_1685_length_3648_cov_226.387997_2_plen_399_part_00